MADEPLIPASDAEALKVAFTLAMEHARGSRRRPALDAATNQALGRVRVEALQMARHVNVGPTCEHLDHQAEIMLARAYQLPMEAADATKTAIDQLGSYRDASSAASRLVLIQARQQLDEYESLTSGLSVPAADVAAFRRRVALMADAAAQQFDVRTCRGRGRGPSTGLWGRRRL